MSKRITLAPLPRSKAKTAWGLLQDVKRAILEEPKRVNMDCFVEKCPPSVYGAEAPACGTVGCFAGWVGILAGKYKGGRYVDDSDARDILGEGLNYYTTPPDGRFDDAPSGGYVFGGSEGLDIHGTRGTMEYARSVVGRINHFMQVNKKALKARKLK